jgi:hypothetical protein
VTIRPGDAWGTRVPPPDGLRTAGSDAEFLRLTLGPERAPVRLVGGDMARTLGVVGNGGAAGRSSDGTVLQVPLDVLEVTSDDGVAVACAHVVAKPPLRRGGWWAGPLVAVMNAQFHGHWDVAPRGHPNDGRVEVLEIGEGMSLRARWAVRRRLPLGTHLPHPAIGSRSVRESTFEFSRPMVLHVDGERLASVRSMSVRVRPDAVLAYV